MSGLVTRYWQNLSPALQRYYRASAWPSLAFIAFAVLHEWTAGKTGLATGVRMVVALAPVASVPPVHRLGGAPSAPEVAWEVS